eukprot:117192_1
MINIECTPLQGGNYAECNELCYEGNSDCYYGTGAALNGEHCYCYTDNGAASPGQTCYCYSDKDLSTIKPTIKPSESKVNTIECTSLEGGNYKDCNANCYP